MKRAFINTNVPMRTWHIGNIIPWHDDTKVFHSSVHPYSHHNTIPKRHASTYNSKTETHHRNAGSFFVRSQNNVLHPSIARNNSNKSYQYPPQTSTKTKLTLVYHVHSIHHTMSVASVYCESHWQLSVLYSMNQLEQFENSYSVPAWHQPPSGTVIRDPMLHFVTLMMMNNHDDDMATAVAVVEKTLDSTRQVMSVSGNADDDLHRQVMMMRLEDRHVHHQQLQQVPSLIRNVLASLDDDDSSHASLGCGDDRQMMEMKMSTMMMIVMTLMAEQRRRRQWRRQHCHSSQLDGRKRWYTVAHSPSDSPEHAVDEFWRPATACCHCYHHWRRTDDDGCCHGEVVLVVAMLHGRDHFACCHRCYHRNQKP
mmetsp:Transcript_13845/g.39429  ORF Transcript_13845/g.39429 Transcript_13845/m.39429 type:complete len:367 (+) Transcript_13845:652-1752(+)